MLTNCIAFAVPFLLVENKKRRNSSSQSELLATYNREIKRLVPHKADEGQISKNQKISLS